MQKFGLVTILSFFLSNILFYVFEKLFNPSIASFIVVIIVFFINIQLFFKTKLFSKNKENYFKLLILSIFFRVFEFLSFNILYLYILTNLKANYIFLITLIFSFFIKTIVYYKNSTKEKITNLKQKN